MPWQDTTSPDWVMRWGALDDDPWLEQQLSLVPGGYRRERADGSLTFVSPHYAGETHAFPLYDLIDTRSGRRWKHVFGEITNGIYAIGYWRGSTT
jgi:hypothetical protein